MRLTNWSLNSLRFGACVHLQVGHRESRAGGFRHERTRGESAGADQGHVRSNRDKDLRADVTAPAHLLASAEVHAARGRFRLALSLAKLLAPYVNDATIIDQQLDS